METRPILANTDNKYLKVGTISFYTEFERSIQTALT